MRSDVVDELAERRFRDAVGMFASGVTVVTVAHDDVEHGMTANAFVSISLRPQLIAVSISERAYTKGQVLEAGHFAVNVLAESQADLALQFAQPLVRGAALFAGVDTTATRLGDPLIEGSLAALGCELASAHDEGDHTIFIGRCTELHVHPAAGDPLLFWRGRFSSTSCRMCIARHDPLDALQAIQEG